MRTAPRSARLQNSSTHSAAKSRLGIAISPTVPTRNRSQMIITRRCGKKVRQTGQQRAARDRRQVGERVGQRGEERRVGSAVDQDGDGHLSELVTGEGEYLGAPQRTELADGEDLAIGRPRLGCPPVTARVDGLAFVRAPGPAGLGPELRRHGLARAQASARVARGVWPVSPSSMQTPQVTQ